MTVQVDTTSSQSRLDLAQVQSFIELIHGDSKGLLHVSTSNGWTGRTFTLDKLNDLLRYVEECHEARVAGIYLRACTLREEPKLGGRGGESDSLEFPGLWADIDIAGPGHKTKNLLPPDESTARSIVGAAGLPTPSLWIHSGGGLYPWWLLRQPVMVTDQDVLERVKALSTGWQDILARGAERLSWHYGTGIGDLARVLRIPGTVNLKVEGRPQPCRIVHGDGDGQMYTFQELEGHLDRARATLETTAPVVSHFSYIPINSDRSEVTPFNDFENKVDWADILEGWTLSKTVGGTRYWTRPGKRKSDGHSATTGRNAERDRLFIFTTETEFEPWRCYTKGAAWAIINGYGNDFSAAAKALRSQGYGVQIAQITPITEAPSFVPPRPADTNGNGHHEPEYVPSERHMLNDIGNAERLAEVAQGTFKFVSQDKHWRHWTGTHWARDKGAKVSLKYRGVMEYLRAEVDQARGTSDFKEINKWYGSSGMATHVNGAIGLFASMVTANVLDFDSKRNLLNLKDCTLDLDTLQVHAHDPKDMLTKQFNASWNPDATAPEWVKFIERAIPDTAMRNYLQRALGYTLLGDSDQRAVFLLHGPSGTGKSQLCRAIELIFGDYGASAAASTFKSRRGDSLPADLHLLMGKRFVTFSETSIGALMDEELIKRITGNDTLTTRPLYGEFVSWRPNCVIWMSTNHLPTLTSDDDAIWRRVKPIRMDCPIGEEQEVGAFAERVLLAESSGILNWLIEGVRMYREEGLRNEPNALRSEVDQYKLETDTAAMFVHESLEEGTLLAQEDGLVATRALYVQYVDWCNLNLQRPLGSRRFKWRIENLGYEYTREKGSNWKGLAQNMMFGVLGTMRR